MIQALGPSTLFDGLIDQLSFTNRTKTAVEILQDATLTVYVPFDNNSCNDQGPLRINGSLVGNITYVPGRVGQAIEINNGTQSNFEVHGLVLLGINNLPYSFAIWIRPYSQQKSAIIHVSDQPDGAGWCLPFLGINNAGQLMASSSSTSVITVTGPMIPANSWTHAAVTYNNASGMRLYVNGTLNISSTAFSYNSSGYPMHVFVGSPSSGMGCVSGYNNSGPYFGAVDEFRVYSRELSAGDVAALANP